MFLLQAELLERPNFSCHCFQLILLGLYLHEQLFVHCFHHLVVLFDFARIRYDRLLKSTWMIFDFLFQVVEELLLVVELLLTVELLLLVHCKLGLVGEDVRQLNRKWSHAEFLLAREMLCRACLILCV